MWVFEYMYMTSHFLQVHLHFKERLLWKFVYFLVDKQKNVIMSN